MVTGVWSKQIREANERHGTNPGTGMAAASVVLAAVTGLGFRLKLRLLRETLAQVMDILHGNHRHSWSGHRTKTFSQNRQGDASRREQQRFEQWTRQHGGAYTVHVDIDTTLEKHCSLLGVRRGCSKQELKAAYYRKAKLHHPDARGSSEAFATLKHAYDTLLPTCAPG